MKQANALYCLAASLLISAAHGADTGVNSAEAENPKGKTMVIMKTSAGDVHIELLEEQAPVTVENFLAYVGDAFYDGTVFHRVIPDFMIQGGGFTEDMRQKRGRTPIRNEANNGVRNERGTLSMARTSDIHSATSQFFINLKDNPFLDHGERDFGYAVFGRVVSGMDVVDRIAGVETGVRGGQRDVPLDPVLIRSIRRNEDAPAATKTNSPPKEEYR